MERWHRGQLLILAMFIGSTTIVCGGGGGSPVEPPPPNEPPPAMVENSAIRNMWAEPGHFGPNKTRTVGEDATVRARFDCGSEDVGGAGGSCDVLAFLIDENRQSIDSFWEGGGLLQGGESREVTFQITAREPVTSYGVRFMMHLAGPNGASANVPSPITKDLFDDCTYCIVWE